MAQEAYWNEAPPPGKAAPPGRHLLARVYQRAVSVFARARDDDRRGRWELTTERGVRTLLVRSLPFSIRCIDGHVWITHRADPGDHVLGPGEVFTASGRGLLVLWAFETSRLFVSGREGWQMSALRVPSWQASRSAPGDTSAPAEELSVEVSVRNGRG